MYLYIVSIYVVSMVSIEAHCESATFTTLCACHAYLVTGAASFLAQKCTVAVTLKTFSCNKGSISCNHRHQFFLSCRIQDDFDYMHYELRLPIFFHFVRSIQLKDAGSGALDHLQHFQLLWQTESSARHCPGICKAGSFQIRVACMHECCCLLHYNVHCA